MRTRAGASKAVTERITWLDGARAVRTALRAVMYLSCLLLTEELWGADAISGYVSDYRNTNRVSVEFGATIQESGLYLVEVADSKHTVAEIDGEVVLFFRGGWNYAYFAIDPASKEKLGSDVVIRAEYQILGNNPMGVQYDGMKGPYSSALDIQREYKEPNSSWRVIEFRARDARFHNRQNRGADFRIYDNEKGFYLKRVSVSRYPGRRISPRDPSMSSNLVDLTSFYNASLRIYMPGGDPDSFTNVVRQIRARTGIDFDLRGYIGLIRRGEEAGRSNSSPESVTGIPVKQKVRKIHFLHCASYGESENTQIGSYILKMGDSSIEDFPIIYGTNVRSERGDFRRLPEAETAWEGEGIRTGAGRKVRILKATWENPRPAVEITQIDFISAVSRSAPHLLAITLEP